MAGRGYYEDMIEIKTSRIFTLRNGRWYKFFRPINPDREFAGVNLAESFAEKYSISHDTEVGLICCADGGTSLNQWAKGEVLFDNAVNMARLAMRSSDLVGILWHQGEADCAPHLTATYKERFLAMITEMKRLIGREDLPVIVGGLGDFLPKRSPGGALDNYRELNSVLEGMADENELIGFASAEGLTDRGDNLHFSSPALYEFGLRYLEAFEKISTDTVEKCENRSTGEPKFTEMELL
jgi:hypothetical protein